MRCFYRAGGVVAATGDYNRKYLEHAVIQNAYINNTNGALVSYSGWYATDFEEINPEGMETNFCKAMTGNNSYYNCWYDENKNYLGYFDTNGTVVIPNNAKYFRLSGTINFSNTYFYDHI